MFKARESSKSGLKKSTASYLSKGECGRHVGEYGDTARC